MSKNLLIKSYLLFSIFTFLGILADQKPFKVLHMSLHHGCIKDFETVAQELNLNLTSIYIQRDMPGVKFDGFACGNQIYDITHERAKNVWNKHKLFFEQFDVILTSDTAPLSRIFLQNGWQKPLIIWICNRFDYADSGAAVGLSPVHEYYELFKKAATQPNVKIVGYVAYEHFYAKSKGIDTGSLVIKPCGMVEADYRYTGGQGVPKSINKQDTLLIPARLAQHQANHLVNQCKELGINAYYGVYNGPYDLKDFKGILAFPYAWSNLALFENMQLGLPYFVPSQKFLRELHNNHYERDLYRFFSLDNLELSEWYCHEHKDIFIYFDSWQDLKNKFELMDYEAKRKSMIEFGKMNKVRTISQWRIVFQEMDVYLKSNFPINK
jgi:hypothetical protein